MLQKPIRVSYGTTSIVQVHSEMHIKFEGKKF